MMHADNVMVVIDEHEWTLRALQLACATAHRDGNQLVLLKMVPVRHHMLLGVDRGDIPIKEKRTIMEYVTLAESHAVDCSICVFQYFAYSDALVSASEQLDAGTIFATFPQEWVAAWRRFKIWWLKTRLARHHRTLHILEPVGSP